MIVLFPVFWVNKLILDINDSTALSALYLIIIGNQINYSLILIFIFLINIFLLKIWAKQNSYLKYSLIILLTSFLMIFGSIMINKSQFENRIKIVEKIDILKNS